jgi:hypothetical protein
VVPGQDPDSNQGSLHQNFLPPSQNSKLPFITKFQTTKITKKKKNTTIKCKNQNFNTNQRNPSLKWDIYSTKACLLRELNNQKRKLKKIGENKKP